MAPRDFSADGAAGAFGGDAASPSPGTSIGGVTANDPGPTASGWGGGDALDIGRGANNNWDGGGISPHGLPPGTGALGMNDAANDPNWQGAMVGHGAQYGSWNTGLAPPGSGFMFDEGGSMPDTSDPAQGDDPVSLALATVDAALQYGRKKYGLGETQTAAAMPTIPGNQSETPGPYKPGGGSQKFAGAMPMIPGNQSETPGPYKPGGGGQKLGAIPDDDQEEAA